MKVIVINGNSEGTLVKIASTKTGGKYLTLALLYLNAKHFHSVCLLSNVVISYKLLAVYYKFELNV